MSLDLAVFEKALATTNIGRSIHWRNELWESIDSTNERAKTLAQEGAPDGLVVMARLQTAGRGRFGRTWISPPDSGLYISFLLRPKLKISEIPLLSLAAGIAAAKTIEKTNNIRIGLKWVNDLVINNKKLGGILAEGTAGAVIVGIGININLPDDQIPEELKAKVEWLDRISTQHSDINVLAAELCLQLESLYKTMQAQGCTSIIDEWKKYSITLGKNIIAQSGKETIEGLAKDIAADGSLIISTHGKEMSLIAGEVTIRNADGSYA